MINKKTKDASVLYKPLSDISAIITPQLKNPQLILDKIDKAAEKAKAAEKTTKAAAPKKKPAAKKKVVEKKNKR